MFVQVGFIYQFTSDASKLAVKLPVEFSSALFIKHLLQSKLSPGALQKTLSLTPK